MELRPAFTLVFCVERLLWECPGHVELYLTFVNLVSGLGRDSIVQILTSVVFNWLVCLLLHKDQPMLCINADKHVVHISLLGTVAV